MLRKVVADKIELEPVGSGRPAGLQVPGNLSLERLIEREATNNTSHGGGPNGIRTRVSALRGPCPRPLDDGAVPLQPREWLGEEDLNPRYQGQNLASYP
jgi:hypothetical protein